MTTIYGVMGALEKQVRAAVAAVVNPANPPALLAIKTGVGWPPVNALQNVARGGALISVYDRKVGRNTTRWSPFSYNQVAAVCTLTTRVLAPQAIPGHGVGAILLGGTVTLGDAVSCIINGPPVTFGPRLTGAVVALSQIGDTPTTMATRLAALINADALLHTWVTALAVGPQVNLSSITAGVLNVQSYAGSGGTRTTELGRRESQLQVTIWAQTQDARQAIVEPIQAMLAAAQVNFGVSTTDGPVRLEMQNDFPIEDDTLEDVYRHDFLVTADFAITTQDALYAVLAPVPQYAVEPT